MIRFFCVSTFKISAALSDLTNCIKLVFIEQLDLNFKEFVDSVLSQ